jgi:hypothetical protein
MTAWLALNVIIGHPLGLAPATLATIPLAAAGEPVGVQALTPDVSPPSPGPDGPPIIS